MPILDSGRAGAVSVAAISDRGGLLGVIEDCLCGSWSRPWGLQLLVYSLVLTRGVSTIEEETDQGGVLVGKFVCASATESS